MKKAIAKRKQCIRNDTAIARGLLKPFHGVFLNVKAIEFSKKQLDSLKKSKAGSKQVKAATYRIACAIYEARLIEGMDF